MKDYFMRSTRLGFSIWDENDINDALDLWSNPRVTQYITADGKMSEQQVRDRLHKEIETYHNHHIQYWPVYLLETDQSIGCCGLRPYDLEKQILELGIHLKEQYWGKGFAKEACLAVIEYAFETLNVHALFSGHNPNNLASSVLLNKLGFIYTHDEFYQPTGLYHPSYLMTKKDYTAYNIY